MVALSHVESMLKVMVDQLVANYAPQRVILFGSYAEDRADSDSDIDLLIIKVTSENLGRRMDDVRAITAGTHPGVPLDPLVLTPDEVDGQIKRGDQFLAQILKRGRVLYAA